MRNFFFFLVLAGDLGATFVFHSKIMERLD